MISINLAKYNLKPNEEAELSQTITNALVAVAKEASKRGREYAYEWKSAEDKLPELHVYEDEIEETLLVSEPVLALTEDDRTVIVCREIWCGKEYWMQDDGQREAVTHWMPLPAKPRRDE